jgi:hypothetical protein
LPRHNTEEAAIKGTGITSQEMKNYFTPAVTSTYNLHDRSFSVTPELLHAPITNLEFRIKAGFIAGQKGTEYGEKQNDYRIELRARCYF